MTVNVASLVSDNLDIWTTAVEHKSGAGRGGGKRISLYGVDRLRELILDLAVRGKLISQNMKDEPAAELLKKIAVERARLAKAGVTWKRKASESDSEDAPYAIPDGWVWTRIADIGHDWGQMEPSGNFTYVDVGSIDQRAGIIRSPSVLSASEAPSRARKIVKKGTVIYSTVRPYLLNIAIVDQDFDPEPIASTAFAIVHPFEGVAASFLYRYLRSAPFIAYVEECQTGIAYPAINDKQFFSAWFPLPPLAEQQRIVAKVDELMALCDALEAESAIAMAAHQVLVEALLATLTTSTDEADLRASWARMEAHFDTLFNTVESIEAFKQTIFELAVRGRLVAQNAEDEPVQMPEFRQVSQSSDWDEKVFQYGKSRFELPPNWEIGPLAQVSSHIVDCPHTTPKWTEEGELCVRTNQIKPRWLNLSQPNYVSVETYNERIERLKPTEGDILYIREGGILGVGCRIPKDVRLCLGQRSMLIRCNRVISSRFMEVLLNSPYLVELAKHWTTGGAAPRVNMSTVRGYPIPTPPLAEQDRIVAKVDELMMLCHLMKADLTGSAQTKRHIADAITERATA